MALPTTTIPPGKSQLVTADPVDGNQQPALIKAGSTLTWTPQDTTIVGIGSLTGDTLTANLVATQKPGTTQVDVSGISSNDQPISSSFVVTVSELAAVGFLFTFGPIV